MMKWNSLANIISHFSIEICKIIKTNNFSLEERQGRESLSWRRKRTVLMPLKKQNLFIFIQVWRKKGSKTASCFVGRLSWQWRIERNLALMVKKTSHQRFLCISVVAMEPIKFIPILGVLEMKDPMSLTSWKDLQEIWQLWFLQKIVRTWKWETHIWATLSEDTQVLTSFRTFFHQTTWCTPRA